VTDQSSNYNQPDEWGRYRSGAADQQYSGQGAAGQQYYGQGAAGQQYYGQATAQSGLGGSAAPPAGSSSKRQGAQEKNFFAALFDFSFNSFINTRVIKVLYVLVVILTVLGALASTFAAFKVNATLGLLTLVIADPLYIIIVLTLWRLFLEALIVFFRMGEDVRTLRERGEMR
jgi:Domain of unknown function (DUF4282)